MFAIDYYINLQRAVLFVTGLIWSLKHCLTATRFRGSRFAVHYSKLQTFIRVIKTAVDAVKV
jgi:hypothetical protein